MKTVFAILSFCFLASCAPSKKLPAPPEIGTKVYYDSAYFKLQQVQAKNKAAKQFERFKITRPTVTTIGVTAFGIYCILAWRFDIE